MKIKEQVSPIRHQNPSLAGDSISFQAINFIEQAWQMHHNSISNNTYSILIQNARWNKMQGKFLSLCIVDSVTSISSALLSAMLKAYNYQKSK